jgi:hypothetical protein
MGVGLWMFERPKYDTTSGVNVTNGTWEYKMWVKKIEYCFLYMKN